MSPTVRAWLHGLAAAALGGIYTALSAALAAPQAFDLTSHAGLVSAVKLALISGAKDAVLYLKQSPLPK